MKPYIGIVRMFLTGLLIYGAYTETGKFTAMSLILIALGMELRAYTENKGKS